MPDLRYVKGCCPLDYQDTCSWVAHVAGGRVVHVEGAKGHPFTRGVLCAKVNDYEQRTYAEDRLLYPVRRSGPKGSGSFTRISWDEALDAIAERFSTIITTFGPEALLPVNYLGSMGVVQRRALMRIFHALGTSVFHGSICGAAGFEACNQVCRHIHGHDRGGELREAMQHGTATVVEHGGRLSEYCTGSGVSGPHAVGETTAAVEALMRAAVAVERGTFRVPLRNGGLLQWCLGHGLRVEVPETLMRFGFYQEPVGAFLPSGLYEVGYPGVSATCWRSQDKQERKGHTWWIRKSSPSPWPPRP